MLAARKTNLITARSRRMKRAHMHAGPLDTPSVDECFNVSVVTLVSFTNVFFSLYYICCIPHKVKLLALMTKKKNYYHNDVSWKSIPARVIQACISSTVKFTREAHKI